MIQTKTELKKVLKYEKNLYFKNQNKWLSYVTGDVVTRIYRYMVLLRKTEYYHNVSNEKKICKLLYLIYRRRKNVLGIKLGLEMWDNSIEQGLLIYHAGNVVINGGAYIGKNCKLHGDNCIGNNGRTYECPVIGENVRIGVGAKVIGDIYIADNITVAAGAVVVDSFYEPGITIGGVPARRIK